MLLNFFYSSGSVLPPFTYNGFVAKIEFVPVEVKSGSGSSPTSGSSSGTRSTKKEESRQEEEAEGNDEDDDYEEDNQGKKDPYNN